MAEEIIVSCLIQMAFAAASHLQVAAVIICSSEML